MKKINVVSLGPGTKDNMTFRAYDALKDSDIIVGYTHYIELIEDLFEGKEFLSTPMRKEVDRVQMAIDQAKEGKTVAMVSSGDSGVYGMAGLVLEMAKDTDVEIEIIPGVPASNSGAALLGAPLMHDYATISLSDLLTPMDLILQRVEAAAKADFVTILYNPASKKRTEHLRKTAEIFLQYRDKNTPCAYVRMIDREGEEKGFMTLEELKDYKADMFTTIFIGNSATRMENGKMITPRGYHL